MLELPQSQPRICQTWMGTVHPLPAPSSWWWDASTTGSGKVRHIHLWEMYRSLPASQDYFFELHRALELQNCLAARKPRALHVRIKPLKKFLYIGMWENASVWLSRESCCILLSAVAPTCGQGTHEFLSGKVGIVVEAVSVEVIVQNSSGPANLPVCEKPGLNPTWQT